MPSTRAQRFRERACPRRWTSPEASGHGAWTSKAPAVLPEPGPRRSVPRASDDPGRGLCHGVCVAGAELTLGFCSQRPGCWRGTCGRCCAAGPADAGCHPTVVHPVGLAVGLDTGR